MKTIRLILILLSCLTILIGAAVDKDKAIKVAKNWYQYKTLGVSLPVEIEMVKENIYNQKICNYVVSIKNDGFVIVAGDDAVVPILGYSSKPTDLNESMPPALQDLLDYYNKQIDYSLNVGLSNQETLPLWNDILNYDQIQTMDYYGPQAMGPVSPMLTTTWHQNEYYNEQCPYDVSGPGNHAYAGCGATAMGQVMKFWNHPDQGTGSHSYSDPDYGTQSANFGATTYNWISMPNSISSSDADIAELLYHCGVAQDMDYGPYGSWSYMNDIESGLEVYFKYSTASQMLYRPNYTDMEWLNLLTTDLNNSMPVIYRGAQSDNSGGHFFILDGYQSDDYFHVNWGWGGSYDGYYYLNDLTPGSGDFSYYQFAIIGIEPDLDCPADLSLQNITIGIGVTESYQASNTITASNIGNYYIVDGNGTSGGNVAMKAGTSISLKPGFNAKSGSYFRAYIGPCD